MSTSVTITPVTSGQMPPPASTSSFNIDSPVTITPVFTRIATSSTNSGISSSGHSNEMENGNQMISSASNDDGGPRGGGGGGSGSGISGSVGVNTKDSENVVVLNKQRLQELVNEIDPREQLDEEVEDLLLNLADDFVDNVVTNACKLAKHRGSKTLEVKDVQLTLEKDWNLFIPGFGSLPLANEFKNLYKKSPAIEAHKQRLALIKKTLKKL